MNQEYEDFINELMDNGRQEVITAISLTNICGMLTINELDKYLAQSNPDMTIAELFDIVGVFKEGYKKFPGMVPFLYNYNENDLDNSYICSALLSENFEDFIDNPETDIILNQVQFEKLKEARIKFGLAPLEVFRGEDIADNILSLGYPDMKNAKKMTNFLRKFVKYDEEFITTIIFEATNDVKMLGISGAITDTLAKEISEYSGKELTDKDITKLANLLTSLSDDQRQWILGGYSIREFCNQNPELIDDYFEFVEGSEKDEFIEVSKK